MAKYAITRVPIGYVHYREFRYTNPKDAVAQACAGWIEFDPTNRIVAGRNLIRVATTRTPAQAVPVSGSFRHDGAAFLGMDVEVSRVD